MKCPVERCPHLRGKFICIFGTQQCPDYRGVPLFGVSFKRGSTVCHNYITIMSKNITS